MKHTPGRLADASDPASVGREPDGAWLAWARRPAEPHDFGRHGMLSKSFGVPYVSLPCRARGRRSVRARRCVELFLGVLGDATHSDSPKDESNKQRDAGNDRAPLRWLQASKNHGRLPSLTPTAPFCLTFCPIVRHCNTCGCDGAQSLGSRDTRQARDSGSVCSGSARQGHRLGERRA